MGSRELVFGMKIGVEVIEKVNDGGNCARIAQRNILEAKKQSYWNFY
jgi:hypothetical protein